MENNIIHKHNIYSLRDKLMEVFESMTIHLDESVITDWFEDSQTQNFLLELKESLEKYPTYYSYALVNQPNPKDIDGIKLFLELSDLKLSTWIFTGQYLVIKHL